MWLIKISSPADRQTQDAMMRGYLKDCFNEEIPSNETTQIRMLLSVIHAYPNAKGPWTRTQIRDLVDRFEDMHGASKKRTDHQRDQLVSRVIYRGNLHKKIKT